MTKLFSYETIFSVPRYMTVDLPMSLQWLQAVGQETWSRGGSQEGQQCSSLPLQTWEKAAFFCSRWLACYSWISKKITTNCKIKDNKNEIIRHVEKLTWTYGGLRWTWRHIQKRTSRQTLLRQSQRNIPPLKRISYNVLIRFVQDVIWKNWGN